MSLHLRTSSMSQAPVTTRHHQAFFKPAVHVRCRDGCRQIRCETTYRTATEADLPAIRQAVLREKMNPLGLDPKQFTVAVDEAGQLQGFGQLESKPSSTDKQFLELRTLIVNPDSRGRGLGTALLCRLLQQAKGHDIYLTTIGQRVNLYKRQGFNEVPFGGIPRCMLFEVFAGIAVAALAVQDRLVVLKRAKEA